MSLSDQAHADLLLTVWFSKSQKGDPKPLAPAEWSRLSEWMRARGVAAEALVTQRNLSKLLDGWTDRSVTVDRLAALLERAGALGLALEKWQRAGLWVITRSDMDYPERLERRLGPAAPPILFGCGHRPLLERGGLAVVGSREASTADLDYTKRLARDIALQGRSVVSGGARGVDETAMLGALEADGTAVGVLPDNLLRAITSARYRKALMNRSLVLVSPFSPEAGFDVGNAMGRNKYIYCLADGAVVVASGKEKGGTWAGALENLKHRWVPLWVNPHGAAGSGNRALVERGGQWLPKDLSDVGSLMAAPRSSWGVADLFAVYSGPANGEPRRAPPDDRHLVMDARAEEANPPVAAIETPGLSLYELFLSKVTSMLCGAKGATPEALRTSLELTKTQLNAWLKRAVAEKRLKKLNKPVRYRIAESEQRSLPL